MDGEAQPPDAEIATRLRVVIGRLYRSFRRDGDSPLSTEQLLLLMAINRSGPVNLTVLATELGVPASNLTRSIAWLGAERLIEREVPAADRRAVVVSTTPEGRRLVDRVESSKARVLAERLASLPAEQQRAVRAVIPVLGRLLDDHALGDVPHGTTRPATGDGDVRGRLAPTGRLPAEGD